MMYRSSLSVKQIITMLIVVAAVVYSCSLLALANDNRYVIVSQYDWGAKSGFYLNFENNSPGQEVCHLSKLKLILGLGDGANWRYITTKNVWETGREYRVKAMVSSTSAELWIDDQLVGRSKGKLKDWNGDAVTDGLPDWAAGRAEYSLSMKSLNISSSAGLLSSPSLSSGSVGPNGMFEPNNPVDSVPGLRLNVIDGTTYTIDAVVKVDPVYDAKALAPVIDKYGQSRFSDWPGKVKSDKDLTEAITDEQKRITTWGMPGIFDKYGGYKAAGWREKGTGRYRLTRNGSYWWLISPEGYPCFYTGICTAPSPTYPKTPLTGREWLFESLPPTGSAAWSVNQWGDGNDVEYVGYITWNLMRKYGDNWLERSKNVTLNRIKAWGFSGIGKWGGQEGVPYMPVLGHSDVPNLVRHPDVFDTDIQDQFRLSLTTQMMSSIDDPYVLGWSVGNEYDEIITLDEVRQILGNSVATPAKRAFISFSLSSIYKGDVEKMAIVWKVKGKTQDQMAVSVVTPSDADLRSIRRYYADKYYEFIYKSVKAIDPSRLYFGFWIVPGWWEEADDWKIVAKHTDVVGYDRYSPVFMDQMLKQLVEESNKPVLLGEFSFPPTYSGSRGFGRYGAANATDEAEAGLKYKEWVETAAAHPNVLGLFWFEYRDQPLTGRGPGHGDDVVYGEHYAFGLVDGADSPKWPLVEQVRQANLSAPMVRLDATRKAKADGK